MKALTEIKVPFEVLKEAIEIGQLDERQRRLVCACFAKGLGYGGVSAVSNNIGIDAESVRRGIAEIGDPKQLPALGIRHKGGGRKKLVDKIPELSDVVQEIVDDSTYGNPEDVIVYTNLSLRKISSMLKDKGYDVGPNVVGRILSDLGYSKQANSKLLQVGPSHPNRDDQFNFINAKCKEWLERGDPVISIDCKKKENLGNFSNNGQEYRKKGDPRPTLDHDFPIKELGKVAPYGVLALNDYVSFINLGTSADTAEFAVESVRRWVFYIGQHTFPEQNKLYIVCDGGGSNSSRSKLWKLSLAQLADELNLEIHVSHLPLGTSRWNKVEHRLFSYISQNWAGKPLINVKTVVKLISSTKANGHKVKCVVDNNVYKTGIKVSEEDYNSIDIEHVGEFPDWNYIIRWFKS